uniref:Putative dead box rna helicase n=1 Tax=Ornithodoros turicata TaxID=34597 RepID=A0A2R5LEQ1_9ACAR
MTELKNLQASGLTTMGSALKNAFDLLNMNRMQTGIDTYGQGRCPFYLEPSIIVVLTDGQRLSSPAGIHEELMLPMHSSVSGSELTKEPFRWDQRIFALVLRLAGTQPPPVTVGDSALAPPDISPVDVMCEVTGGRSFCVTSHRILMQCLEALVQKVQGGVVINFEKIGADPPPIEGEEGATTPSPAPTPDGQPPPWHSVRKLIYVQRSAQKGYSVGHWPIPEAFWPDTNSPSLPPRSAHPNVKFTCTQSEPMVIDNLPFDKYELESSPLTQFILSRKQPTVAWQVFVTGSHKSCDQGHAFGYLKASTTLACVNLFVLPYNYPVLLPLLDDLFKVYRCKPPRDWKHQFDAYLKNMPLYYAGPLKRALQRMGAPNLVPETMENCLSYSVLNYLKRLKNQAKAEFEKLVAAVGAARAGSTGGSDGLRAGPGVPRPTSGDVPKLSEMPLSWNPALRERLAGLRADLSDFVGFVVAREARPPPDAPRNPFDVARGALLDQVSRLRALFLHGGGSGPRCADHELHSLPVSQMGNYQEYLKRMPTPLREIESTPVRQHMFGNPFKIEKRMMVDEADIDLVGGAASAGGGQVRGLKRPAPAEVGLLGPRQAKRKPGPLPRDFPLRRSPSPAVAALDQSPGGQELKRPTPVLGSVVSGEMGVLEEAPCWGDSNNVPWDDGVASMPIHNGISPPDTPAVPVENGRLRALLLKLVRRPGQNFEQLFELLGLVRGGTEARVGLARQVRLEAGRFKRRRLVRLLEDWEQSLLEATAAAFPAAC